MQQMTTNVELLNIDVELISAVDWTRIEFLLNVIKHDKYNNTVVNEKEIHLRYRISQLPSKMEPY